MISHKLWVVVRRKKARVGIGHIERWEIDREGWFLFGLLPLYIRDLRIRLMN